MTPSALQAATSFRTTLPEWHGSLCVMWLAGLIAMPPCPWETQIGRQITHDWTSRNAVSVAAAVSRARGPFAGPRG